MSSPEGEAAAASDHGQPLAGADPRDAYRTRLEAAELDRASSASRETWIGNARLASLALAALLAWFAFGTRSLSGLWIAPPALLFVVLAVFHDRATRRREDAESRLAFYGFGLRRLDDTWRGAGTPGADHAPADHPYADDLDLFGEASLFEKLCTARTPAGEATLASWLTHTAGRDESLRRQSAVRELAPKLEFRERMATRSRATAHRMNPERLRAWGAGEVTLRSRTPRWIAGAISAFAVASLIGWAFAGTGFLPVLIALAVLAAAGLSQRPRVRPVLAAVEAPTRDLALFAQVLEVIEAEPFEGEALRALRSRLDTQGIAPSLAVAKLRRLADLTDARRNQFFVPFAGLLLWGTQLAFAIEDWRDAHGEALGEWIDAVGEFEALASVAGLAFENPQDPYPTIVADGPVFDGRALGHPLLPREKCITNDLELGRTRRAFIMSGSNMSGKSTMLRTVGANAVLAMLGAPVRAESLTLSPLRIGASLQVRDSLQDGVSHFYAELVRLRGVVELAGPPPAGEPGADAPGLLFLLDEILHGTNSHDRRIGAEAVIRGLVERGAIGIATTHDLALAEMADDDGAAGTPTIENVHFADDVVDGSMHFDYRLKPGVVRGSNAIALMRIVGLEV